MALPLQYVGHLLQPMVRLFKLIGEFVMVRLRHFVDVSILDWLRGGLLSFVIDDPAILDHYVVCSAT